MVAMVSSPRLPPIGSQWAVYVCPSEGVGQALSLPAINYQLSLLPRDSTLWLLAAVAHWADQAVPGRRNSVEAQVKLARTILSDELVAQALPLVGRGAAVTTAQAALCLAVRAIQRCRPGAVSDLEEQDRLLKELGNLLLAIGDHLGVRTGRRPDLTLESARSEIFYHVSGHAEWCAVAWDLFFETLPAMRGHTAFVDPDALLRPALGMTLEEYWVTTAAFGMASDGLEFPPRFKAPLDLGDPAVEARVTLWLPLLTLNEAEAAQKAALDERNGNWSFTAFYSKPILRLDSGDHFPMRSRFLAEKATPQGLYWTVADEWRSHGGKYEDWSGFFGLVVEQYAWQLLDEFLPHPSRVWKEDELADRWGPGAVCDAVIDYGDAWIALDFVHHPLTKATQVLGDFDDFVWDIELGVLKKFGQLEMALQRGMAVERPSPSRIFPVVIAGAGFPGNPLAGTAVTDLWSTEGYRFVKGPVKLLGRNGPAARPVVMDLMELRGVLRSAKAHGKTALDLIAAWHATGPERSLHGWLASDGPTPPPEAEESTWFQKVLAALPSPP